MAPAPVQDSVDRELQVSRRFPKEEAPGHDTALGRTGDPVAERETSWGSGSDEFTDLGGGDSTATFARAWSSLDAARQLDD